jgi:hypothetical protein
MAELRGESRKHMEGIGQDDLQVFRSIFVAREDAYVIWKNEKPVALREPLTDAVLAAHLRGAYRVGTYLINSDGRTPFLVIDVDERKRSLVKRILKRLRNRKVPAYLERSKSKGFHIWVFFDRPLLAPQARAFARLILRGLEDRKIEIFPKQDKIARDGLGNCIFLPLFGLDIKAEHTVFLDDALVPIRKQWRFLTEIERVSKKRVVRLCAGLSTSAIKRFPRLPNNRRAPEATLPLCAQRILFEGVEDGNRNTALFTLAKHLRNAGLERGRVAGLLGNANEQCQPPLEDREMAGIVRSVFTGGYTSLGCDNTFIASLCGKRCPVKHKQSENGGTSVDQILEQVETKPHLHAAQAFHDGHLYYGLRVGQKKCVWINSERKGFTLTQMRERFSLDRPPTKSGWSIGSVKRFLHEGSSVRPDVLFSNLKAFFNRRIHFLAPWQATVVVLWVMGTYVHRLFDWYGYLWLTSPGRRTGKTRLLEIISALAYNASSVMTDPTEAALFRDTALNASTQVLDENESLRGADQEKRAGLMSMLNDGFKAGAVIPRYNMKAGTIENLEVFCPRALAGINRLAPTLADRCFRIFLKRKRTDEHVARFNQRVLSRSLQKKRDNLHKFGLLFAPAIAQYYENGNTLPIPPETDDRARDILEPLFAIARLLDEQSPALAVTKQLIESAKKIARDRDADEGEDETVVAALEALSVEIHKQKDPWKLTSQDACAIFQKHDNLEWVTKRKWASSILRQLGFRSSSHRPPGGGRVFRGYAIKRTVLIDLCERYGLDNAK